MWLDAWPYLYIVATLAAVPYLLYRISKQEREIRETEARIQGLYRGEE